MRSFKLSLLVCLVLLSSPLSLAAQDLALSLSEQELTAEKFKDLDMCKMDLESTNAALTSCQGDVVLTQPSFFQQPSVIIGGFAVTFTIGTIFGLTKCFGLCK